jgi:protein-tyrosine-phosphatase
MAEGMFRKAVEKRADFEVASAGIAAYPGDEANPETVRFLAGRGITLEGFSSQQVSPELLEQATHVFAMTSGHLETLESLFPDYSDKFFLVCEFVAWGKRPTRRWVKPSTGRFPPWWPSSTRPGWGEVPSRESAKCQGNSL